MIFHKYTKRHKWECSLWHLLQTEGKHNGLPYGPNELTHAILLKYMAAIKRNETVYCVVILKIPKTGEVKSVVVITKPSAGDYDH